MMVLRLALAVLLGFLGPLAAVAQTEAPQATLIADSVTVDPSGTLSASGNVEVFFDGTRLTATSVSYDQTTDQLRIEGPIVLTEPGGTILLADAAALSSDLREGILISARLVLERQLQLAAAEIRRADPRYTELDRVVASSCEVCAQNPTPLWEIRARRVVHDRLERQLYFDGAQIRVAGVPIFYTPRLRLPDPTLERAQGFLIPQFRQSSELGVGVKVPYFVPIGRHADLTFTPYLSAKTETLELRYRQELSFGSIVADAALTSDDLEGKRGYLFGEATAYLARGYSATLSLELVSDPGYLFVYGYSEADRLENELRLERVREKDSFLARIVEFRTLRDAEIPIRDTLPDTLGELIYTREIPSLSFGGKTVAQVRAATLTRNSGTDVDGRDVSRLGAAIDWRRQWIWGNGMVFATEAGLSADAYNIGQDSNFATNVSRIVPRGAAELRWPMARTTASGAQEILEPIIRLDVAEVRGPQVPNEDSRTVEFDEGNLFTPSRFPGVDGVEDGTRLALGASWRRVDLAGREIDLSLGRLIRLDGALGFGEGTGLTGDRSEWLASVRYDDGAGFSIFNRSLFSDDFEFTLSETRLNWTADRFSIGSTYVFAEPEPAEGRTERLSELAFDGALDLTDFWTARTDFRYDVTAGRAARTGVSLEFANECILLSLSLSRRFASSTSVSPTTDIGLRVSLNGVGGSSDRNPRRISCRG